MKAFWWYKKDQIAGMARPGFNGTHFYDLTFDEMTLLGWLGQHSCGEVSLQEFRDHCEHYMPRIFPIIKMDAQEGWKKVEPLLSTNGFHNALQALNIKTNFFESFDLVETNLKFKLNLKNLDSEIEALKLKGITTIIALTEKHHQRDQLAKHFDVHHFSIPDMTAPNIEQAKQVAKIIEATRVHNGKVAVHCLAGIGRTSTILMASHVFLGEKLEDVKAQILKINPTFKFHGPQAEFLDSLK